MSNTSLSTVAIHVVDQYGSTGKHLAQAWRNGVERLVGGANARYADFLDKRSLPLVNEQVKSDLINAQQLLAGFVLKGVRAGSERATLAIDAANARATSGIQALANTASRVETAFDTQALDTVRTLNMPAATLAAQLADKIAQGAKAVESRIAAIGDDAEESAAVVAKPVRRAARKS